MGRRANTITEQGPEGPQLPGGDELLAALSPVLQPLIRLLLTQGVDYARLAAHLKPLFLEQAWLQLARRGQKQTDSAVSLLSGVHRKDVREWRERGLDERSTHATSLSSQVFAAWKDEPAYCDREGRPRILPRTGPAPSFETLVRLVSTDVHPFTVLNDLVRLGVASLEVLEGEECVVLNNQAFVPAPGSVELLQLYSGNLADHIATATSNLLEETPARLEQSVFADGLSLESAERLSTLARTLWDQAHTQFITLARRLYEQDKDGDHPYRLRFGAYYYMKDEAGTPAIEQGN